MKKLYDTLHSRVSKVLERNKGGTYSVWLELLARNLVYTLCPLLVHMNDLQII